MLFFVSIGRVTGEGLVVAGTQGSLDPSSLVMHTCGAEGVFVHMIESGTCPSTPS